MTNEQQKLPKKRVKHDYVDNKRLFAELTTYVEEVNKLREQGLEREHWPEVPKYVTLAIKNIATNLSYRFNFIGYSFREEMVGDGIENCFMYLHNFDCNHKAKNAFGYINRIIWQAFIRRIKHEEKERYVKYKSALNHSMNMSFDTEHSINDSNDLFIDSNAEKYAEFIDKFESSNKIIKKKKEQENEKKGIERFIKDE